MSECSCKHDGNKLTDVCGLHHEFARNYSKKEIERLEAELNRVTDRLIERDKKVARLRAAILDLKAYWYADPDPSTWGGALPRLFQALETDDE